MKRSSLKILSKSRKWIVLIIALVVVVVFVSIILVVVLGDDNSSSSSSSDETCNDKVLDEFTKSYKKEGGVCVAECKESVTIEDERYGVVMNGNGKCEKGELECVPSKIKLYNEESGEAVCITKGSPCPEWMITDELTLQSSKHQIDEDGTCIPDLMNCSIKEDPLVISYISNNETQECEPYCKMVSDDGYKIRKVNGICEATNTKECLDNQIWDVNNEQCVCNDIDALNIGENKCIYLTCTDINAKNYQEDNTIKPRLEDKYERGAKQMPGGEWCVYDDMYIGCKNERAVNYDEDNEFKVHDEELCQYNCGSIGDNTRGIPEDGTDPTSKLTCITVGAECPEKTISRVQKNANPNAKSWIMNNEGICEPVIHECPVPDSDSLVSIYSPVKDGDQWKCETVCKSVSPNGFKVEKDGDNCIQTSECGEGKSKILGTETEACFSDDIYFSGNHGTFDCTEFMKDPKPGEIYKVNKETKECEKTTCRNDYNEYEIGTNSILYHSEPCAFICKNNVDGKLVKKNSDGRCYLSDECMPGTYKISGNGKEACLTNNQDCKQYFENSKSNANYIVENGVCTETLECPEFGDNDRIMSYDGLCMPICYPRDKKTNFKLVRDPNTNTCRTQYEIDEREPNEDDCKGRPAAPNGREYGLMSDGKCLAEYEECSGNESGGNALNDEETRSLGGVYKVYNNRNGNAACMLMCDSYTPEGRRVDFKYPDGKEVNQDICSLDSCSLNYDVNYSISAIGCYATNFCRTVGEVYNNERQMCSQPIDYYFINLTDKRPNIVMTLKGMATNPSQTLNVSPPPIYDSISPSTEDGNIDDIDSKPPRLMYFTEQSLDKLSSYFERRYGENWSNTDTFKGSMKSASWQDMLEFSIPNFSSEYGNETLIVHGFVFPTLAEIGQIDGSLKRPGKQISFNVGQIKTSNIYNMTLPVDKVKMYQGMDHKTYEVSSAEVYIVLTYGNACPCYENNVCKTKEYCEQKQKELNERGEKIRKEMNDVRNTTFFEIMKLLTIPTQPTEIVLDAELRSHITHHATSKVTILIDNDGVPRINGKLLYLKTPYSMEDILDPIYGTYNDEINQGRTLISTDSSDGGVLIISVLVAKMDSKDDKTLILFKTDSPDNLIRVYNIGMYYRYELIFKINNVFSWKLIPKYYAYFGYSPPLQVGSFPPSRSNLNVSKNILDMWKRTPPKSEFAGGRPEAEYKFSEFASLSGSKDMSEAHKKEWYLVE